MEKYVWDDGQIPTINIHSIKKHEVFREYVSQYIKILGGTKIYVDHLDITLVDAFSGGGLYTRKDGNLHEGSPLILLRAAEEATFKIQQEKKFSLNAHYIFLDEKKRYLDFLRNYLIDQGYGQRIGSNIFLNCGQFVEQVDNIISYIKKRKGQANRCIFLLDQYGWSDVTIPSLRKIFLNLPHAEAIVTFSVDAMIDYMSETAPQYLKALDTLGIDTDITRDLLSEKSQKGWRTVVQHRIYRALIRNLGMRDRLFHTNFFIKSSESSRSYWLLHFSTHPKARDEMMKLHWQFHNHFVHEGRAGLRMLMYDPRNDIDFTGQSSFVFDDPARKSNERALLYDIPSILDDCGEICVGDFIRKECNQTTATQDHILDVIKTLYTDGVVGIKTDQYKDKRKGAKIKTTDIIKLPSQTRLFTFGFDLHSD